MDDLTHLLKEGESDRAEFKESLLSDNPTKVREAICAFANDLPGHGEPGVVFVGVRDDRTVAGLAVTDELLRQLADMKTDGNIVPPPSMTVTKLSICSEDVVVVMVQPSDSPPVRYKRQDTHPDRATAGAGHRARRTNPQRKATLRRYPFRHTTHPLRNIE